MSKYQFGIIGFPLGHSFSPQYFNDKFRRENIHNCSYQLFPLPDCSEFGTLLSENPHLCGLNVTLPHKENIMAHLDALDETAQKVGAVNCIKISHHHCVGYNTDCLAFEKTLLPLLQPHHQQALVLGYGGAAKAVGYVLEKNNIAFRYVCRQSHNEKCMTYNDLSAEILQTHHLIVQATPLGMYPEVHTSPPIDYSQLGSQHLCYDLIYNPAETQFLKQCAEQGAATKNGLQMLYLQAEAAWQIWKKKDAEVFANFS
ncbi:MAG: shikimate dehydrogenase [Chitinophagales bacterium]|jgi:shikimate dehydrogenase|nr:shikimate dehydrogenase [Chitinophagales bacterium]